MIDFHCHLDLYPDPHDVADECRRRGIYVLSVTTTPSAWKMTSALSTGRDRIRTALGLHPQIAHERLGELALFDELLPGTRYVGEVGLDGSPELRRHWADQLAVFNHILRACEHVGGRVISIHSRRAASAVLDCLAAFPSVGTPVLHWFSGNRRELDRAVSMGCWFSVGPAMLLSEKGRLLAANMPRDRILTETDGPFAQLANTALVPWQASAAVAQLAETWSISSEEAQDKVSANFRVLAASLSTDF